MKQIGIRDIGALIKPIWAEIDSNFIPEKPTDPIKSRSREA